MSFFEVETAKLNQQGPVLRGQGDVLGPVAARAREIGARASACGTPEATAALNWFANVLARRTELMGESLRGIADALYSTAGQYDRVDSGIAEQLQQLGGTGGGSGTH